MKSSLKFIKYGLKSDVFFVWFGADVQAIFSVFFAKILRRKIIVVAGGYDVVYEPKIQYGVFMKWYRAAMSLIIFKESDVTIPISESTKRELLQKTKPKKVVLIYNGIDTDYFKPQGEKKDIVMTVGAITKSNLKRKGLETFVKTSVHLPETRFVLVGSSDGSIERLKRIAGENVEFKGFVKPEKLLSLYQGSKIYAQLSFHEGFGVALAEAMSCECIPIVTRRAALPEVVGNCGIYVPYDNDVIIAEKIRQIFNDENLILGRKSRKRIEERFSLKRREEELVKLIKDMMIS
jgi:glycosyltransferase involved in cell wall biosynthesis